MRNIILLLFLLPIYIKAQNIKSDTSIITQPLYIGPVPKNFIITKSQKDTLKQIPGLMIYCKDCEYKLQISDGLKWIEIEKP